MMTKDNNKIIIALDYSNKNDVFSLCEKINPNECRLKIGKQLFTKYGPEIVNQLQNKGFEIFLDLKFHDIPTTVYKACVEAYKLGIWMLNIHLLGGKPMIDAAINAKNEVNPNAKLIGVTLLTSHSSEDLEYIGNEKRSDVVNKLSMIANELGLDGIVCSPNDIKDIKSEYKNLDFVTPGIRLDKTSNDHSTTCTPEEAINLGSTYLVIGRPITESKDPKLVIKQILSSI